MQSFDISDDSAGKVVTIYVKSPDNHKIRYRMKEFQSFRRLHDVYCAYHYVSTSQMQFKYNGEDVYMELSPFLLDMKNGSIIHSSLRQERNRM